MERKGKKEEGNEKGEGRKRVSETEKAKKNKGRGSMEGKKKE